MKTLRTAAPTKLTRADIARLRAKTRKTRDSESLLPREGWAFLAALALLVAPTMAEHVRTSPAHAGTRAAFHALHESLLADALRSIQSMTNDVRPATARTREGDK